ncbi:MAG TPA: LemA family protein [Terriglobia bacterium]|nr:LemA family protein [Terriglobia bacterium]
MDIPLRKILRTLYPGRFSGGNPNSSAARPGKGKWKRYILRALLVFALLNLFFLFFYYNSFLSMEYDVQEAMAQVDTQLQRRMNIILNLSLMVRDYAKHEREIFTHTTDTRKEMLGPDSGTPPTQAPPSNRGQNSPGPTAPEGLDGLRQKPANELDALLSKPQMTVGDLDALLSRVFAVAERYPDLRLSENFQRFMDALVDAENNIAEQRMIYNQRANIMSTAVGKFPGFVFAKIYGFEAPLFFEPEDEARKPPKLEQVTP